MAELEAHWKEYCDYIKVVCERCQSQQTRLQSSQHDCVEFLLNVHFDDDETISSLKAELDELRKNCTDEKAKINELQNTLNQLKKVQAFAKVIKFLCCDKGHSLKYRTTPKDRGLGRLGSSVNCDKCRRLIVDVANGHYTCDEKCDYDECKDCYN